MFQVRSLMETALLCHDSGLTFVPHSKSNFYFLIGESFKDRRQRKRPARSSHHRRHPNTPSRTSAGKTTPGRQTPVRTLAGRQTPTTDTNDEADEASRVIFRGLNVQRLAEGNFQTQNFLPGYWNRIPLSIVI